MSFYISDLYSKWDQVRSFLPIWSRLLKISVMKNFTFCAVQVINSCIKPALHSNDKSFLLSAILITNFFTKIIFILKFPFC